nr:CehA/McbA family metallohydrolase [uncultured Enterobacter sp.]
MHIQHKFGVAEYELFTTRIPVYGKRGIDITLEAGPFEHFFLLVKDPHQRLRALLTWKTRIQHYQIREAFCCGSNNTLPGEMCEGEWTFTLLRPAPIEGHAGYHVQLCDPVSEKTDTDFCPVLGQEWSACVNGESRWYRGDLHAHSEYSDGRVTLSHIHACAQAKELDFLALTDHSVVTTRFPKGGALVIPATELTFDNDIHYNVSGLKHLIDYTDYFSGDVDKSSVLTALHHDLASNGALITLNHPFSSGMSLRHEFDLRAVHLLEVINAPHLADEPVDNEKAIRFFDFLWRHGHRLTAVGGSDAHKANAAGVYPLGLPTTSIYCHGLSLENLLTGLRRGHTVIGNGVNVSLMLRHNEMTILPGDEVCGEVTFNGESAGQALTWRLIGNGECVASDTSNHFTASVNLKPGQFYRLEAKLGQKTVFFANPVFCALKPATEFHFSALRDRFLAADV